MHAANISCQFTWFGFFCFKFSQKWRPKRKLFQNLILKYIICKYLYQKLTFLKPHSFLYSTRQTLRNILFFPDDWRIIPRMLFLSILSRKNFYSREVGEINCSERCNLHPREYSLFLIRIGILYLVTTMIRTYMFILWIHNTQWWQN